MRKRKLWALLLSAVLCTSSLCAAVTATETMIPADDVVIPADEEVLMDSEETQDDAVLQEDEPGLSGDEILSDDDADLADEEDLFALDEAGEAESSFTWDSALIEEAPGTPEQTAEGEELTPEEESEPADLTLLEAGSVAMYLSQAKPLSLNETVVIDPAVDPGIGYAYIYAFTALKDSMYTFFSFSEEKDADPYFRLFSADGTYLDYNDDGGTNGNFSLTAGLKAGQSYLAVATFYSTEDMGAYRFMVTEDSSSYHEAEPYTSSGLYLNALGNDDVYQMAGQRTPLSVLASYPDAGTVTYRWVERSYNEVTDSYDETDIPGATGPTYIPPAVTVAPGEISTERRYRCYVVWTDGNTSEDDDKTFYVYDYPDRSHISAAAEATQTSMDYPITGSARAAGKGYVYLHLVPVFTGSYTFSADADELILLDQSGNALQSFTREPGASSFEGTIELGAGISYYIALHNPSSAQQCLYLSVARTGFHTEHSYGPWSETRAATVEREGEERRYCTAGDHEESRSTPKHVHTFGAWQQTKAATAVAAGEKIRRCTSCGESETQSIAKLPATLSLNVRNNATVPLQVKKSTKAIKANASSLGLGDSIVSWTSSNKKIATISKGKIVGRKKGKAKITFTTKGGAKVTFTVKVQAGQVTTRKLAVNASKVSLKKGQRFTIQATVTPVTSQQKVTYTTSDKKVASVSKKGMITAKKKGKATITVKSGSKKKTIKVVVQ